MPSNEMWLRMAAVKGVNGARIKAYLTKTADSAPSDAQTLLKAVLTPRQHQRYQHCPSGELAAARRWLAQPGHHVLAITDPRYPCRLATLDCPPPALFVAGDPACLETRQLAMVGSRQYSLYGKQWGDCFAGQLSAAGLTITSGLALGIDGVCHRAALAAGGKTVAVLGCGIGYGYPRQHRRLAADIVVQHGALVSEFLPFAPPLAMHFPFRNRLISGLSLGVLVVEAAMKSGSLVTARCASDQGREVFALPGPLGSPSSDGTHWLIRQGATLITRPEEIFEQLCGDLKWLAPNKTEIISAPECEVKLPFADVLANVGDEVTPVDVVAERAGQPVPEVVVKLLELELAGWIAVVPGGYVRLRRAGHVRRTNVFV